MSERREFAVNAVLLVAANALVKPVYLLGVDLGVQNAVGTAEYGRYATWYAFALLFGVVYDLGLHNYNSVALSRDPASLRERLPVVLSLKLVLSVLFAAIVVAAAYATGARDRALQLAGLAAAYHAALSLWQLLRTNLGAQGRHRVNSLLGVVDKALLVLGLGAVLLVPAWRARLTIEGFFAAQLAALAVATALTVAATRLAPGQRWWRWEWRAVRGLVAAALPYGLVLLLTTAFTRLDVVMVEALTPGGRGAYAAGVYAAAYRLLDAVNVAGVLFAGLLLPMLTQAVARGEPAAALMRQASGYLLALGVGVATWTSLHGQALTGLLYREAAAESGAVLAVLMWSAIGVGLAYVHGSYLLARGRLRALNGVFAAALAVNLALNAWLIPRYGPAGAAAATVATQGGVGLWEVIVAARREGAAVTPAAWRLLGYGGLVLATAYLLPPAALGTLGSLAACAVACAVGGLATGLLDDPRSLLRANRP